jgi:hypothetical protein
LFKCSEKNKVETRMVEANGFKPSLDDAELLAKGFEKLIMHVEKAFNVFVIVNC